MLHFGVIMFVTGPIGAEYWVRELIAVKYAQARSLPSPRIIFLGGSSVLLGIDARQVETDLGTPAMNMGLHAGMSLDRILAVGRNLVRSNDVVVLALEHTYYRCSQASLDGWQLRNALAWDRSFFDGMAPSMRVRAISRSGGPALTAEILATRLGGAIAPKAFAQRLTTLAPTETIVARYRSGALRTSHFAYSAYNLDSRGDLLNNDSAIYRGPGVLANQPDGICSSTLDTLRLFVRQMKELGVRVVFAHAPYLIEGVPAAGWREAERHFKADVASIGADMLDRREELFMSRADFFNTSLHLNSWGRYERTRIAITDLKRLEISGPKQTH